jgi:hypothetical protein
MHSWSAVDPVADGLPQTGNDTQLHRDREKQLQILASGDVRRRDGSSWQWRSTTPAAVRELISLRLCFGDAGFAWGLVLRPGVVAGAGADGHFAVMGGVGFDVDGAITAE